MKNGAIIFCFTILTNLCLHSQTPTDSAALRALSVGYIMPQERVYLHFDNNAYFLGETIWFKAFVTSHDVDRPTTVSKVLYVELLAPEGYVVKTEKYKIGADGTCHGEFFMDTAYLSGFYEIRAYTRYMLNWGEHAVFSRVFPVYDKVNNGDWSFRNIYDRKRSFRTEDDWINNELPDCDLKFYPEGGHLVCGLESRVAFELKGVDGIEGETEITILANGNPIIKASPVHLGKGSFILTPQPETEYTATTVAKDKKGNDRKYEFPLPTVEKEGVVVSVSEIQDSIQISIKHNYHNDSVLGCVIMHRSSLGFYKRITNSSSLFSIAKSAIPEGVSRVVIFRSRIPLAERLFFVLHNEPQTGDHKIVKLNATANGIPIENFTPCSYEKITITMERDDGKEIEDVTDFAVSVTDNAGHIHTSWGYNMYSYLLLGSEIKGYIPNVKQYFDIGNRERDMQLDLVMLTNGWTAYDWNKLTNTDLTRIVEPEKGLRLRGQLYKRLVSNKFGEKGKVTIVPCKRLSVTLSVPTDGKIKAYRFKTDKDGCFDLALEDFYGKKVVALTPKSRIIETRGSKAAFSLDRYFSPTPRLLSYWELNTGSPIINMNEQEEDSLVKRLDNLEYELSAVNITSKRNKDRFKRAPISELRLNYMDEWEYALDVTYKYGVYDFARKERTSKEDATSDNELFVEFQSDYSDDTEKVFRYNKKDTYYKNLPQEYEKGYYIFRDNLPQYSGSLTVSNVITSIFARYSLHWCYWVMPAVIKGEYKKDSIPQIDKEYLKGVDVKKMTNFSEIIISSDERYCNSITGGEGFWNSKKEERIISGELSCTTNPFTQRSQLVYSAAFKPTLVKLGPFWNKHPYSFFYDGFYTMKRIHPTKNEIKSESGNLMEHNRNDVGQEMQTYKLKERLKHPNYVAYLVPAQNDSTNTLIKVDLSGEAGKRRYTSFQGYTESKQFYSPDYSKEKPTLPDYRRTLLWHPAVKVVDGKLQVELYNSSECNAIKVEALGYENGVMYMK